jgi:hypothetical protein
MLGWTLRRVESLISTLHKNKTMIETNLLNNRIIYISTKIFQPNYSHFTHNSVKMNKIMNEYKCSSKLTGFYNPSINKTRTI